MASTLKDGLGLLKPIHMKYYYIIVNNNVCLPLDISDLDVVFGII